MIRLLDFTTRTITTPVTPKTVPPGVAMLGTTAVWNGTRGKDVVVGVLDTGIDYNHPDLKSRVVGGVNLTPDYGGSQIEFMDNNGHGTHCAGTIAADGLAGVLGMAPEASLLGIKVLQGNGNGSMKGIVDGILWLVEYKRRHPALMVIGSLSLGAPAGAPDLERAVKYAKANDVQLICAAGNEGPNTINYPAYYEDAVSVGAVNNTGDPAIQFSSTNGQVDVSAPGVDVLSTQAGGGYVLMTGTSMATPHVAGFAALLAAHFRSRHGRWPSDDELFAIVKVMTADVTKNGAAPGVDAATGAGLISFEPFKVAR